MEDAYQEAAWGGNPFLALYEARKKVEDLKSPEGKKVMLSAYITVINHVRSVPGPKDLGTKALLGYWAFEADRLAASLLRVYDLLNSDQLDVLANWLVGMTERRVPWRSVSTAHAVALRSLELAGAKGKPHQHALALTTYARVQLLQHERDPDCVDLEVLRATVHRAISCETAVREEKEQPLPLRQFARVLKNAGEILLRLGDTEYGIQVLRKALDLAQGEAGTASQVLAIEKLLTEHA